MRSKEFVNSYKKEKEKEWNEEVERKIKRQDK